MKNIIGYQKKGRLEILDRETTNYKEAKPATPLQTGKRPPPGSALKRPNDTAIGG